MKFTAKYFRDNYPEWKRKKDWPPTRYFYRQISFYLSAFFANLGWSANSVSFFLLSLVSQRALHLSSGNRFLVRFSSTYG